MRAVSAEVVRPSFGMDQVIVKFDVPCAVNKGQKFATLGYAPRGEGPKYVIEVLGLPLDEVKVI